MFEHITAAQQLKMPVSPLIISALDSCKDRRVMDLPLLLIAFLLASIEEAPPLVKIKLYIFKVQMITSTERFTTL